MGLDSLSRLHRKARDERIHVGVGIDLCAIKVQLATPDQLLRLSLLNDGIEEAAKDVDPIAFTDTGETRMIGQGFPQVIP